MKLLIYWALTIFLHISVCGEDIIPFYPPVNNLRYHGKSILTASDSTLQFLASKHAIKYITIEGRGGPAKYEFTQEGRIKRRTYGVKHRHWQYTYRYNNKGILIGMLFETTHPYNTDRRTEETYWDSPNKLGVTKKIVQSTRGIEVYKDSLGRNLGREGDWIKQRSSKCPPNAIKKFWQGNHITLEAEALSVKKELVNDKVHIDYKYNELGLRVYEYFYNIVVIPPDMTRKMTIGEISIDYTFF